jgi:hypothetical protein
MKVYIDMDSGTVLSGPIRIIEGVTEIDVEIMCESDEVARHWGEVAGREVN